MFKKTAIVLFASLSFLAMTTSANAMNVDDIVEVEYDLDIACNPDLTYCKNLYRYSILPQTDGLIVKHVEVNNGRCAAQTKNFNRLLTQDDYAEFTTITDENGRRCRPRIVTLDTNKGRFDFTF